MCFVRGRERERHVRSCRIVGHICSDDATIAPIVFILEPHTAQLTQHSTAQPQHNTHNTKDDYAMTGNKLHAPSTLCWTALWLSLILIGITLLRLLRAYMCRHIHHHPVRREPPRKKHPRADGWLAGTAFSLYRWKISILLFLSGKKKNFYILSRLFVRSFFKYIFLLAEGGLCSPSAIVHRVYSRYNRRHLPLYPGDCTSKSTHV